MEFVDKGIVIKFSSVARLRFCLGVLLFFFCSSLCVSSEIFMVSNYPESISSPGLVFVESVKTDSLRVLYHHKNISDKPLMILVLLSNGSDVNSTVRVQKGEGGSSEDIVYAGHKAALEFMSQLTSSPSTVDVPSLSTVSVIQHKIKPGQTSSGVFRVSAEDDARLMVKMMVVDMEFPHLSGFSDISGVLSQFRVATFEESSRTVQVRFDAQDGIKSVEIGGKPYLKDRQLQYELKGNYGLLHTVEVTLVNSLKSRTRVHFFFSPKIRNAVDRGVILVDGELREIELLGFKDNIVSMQHFHEVFLDAFETKQLQLITMPQSGCYYPVDIVMKTGEATL